MANIIGREDKELEKELRQEWNKWQSESHPEDCMPFIDYCEEIGSFKGKTITVERRGYECKILFS